MAAGAALVALMFAAALSVAAAQESLVARLRAAAPQVKRWGAVVLMVVGAWFLVLAIWAEAFAGLFPV